MENAAAQNSFGICLERGVGGCKNLSLAALFYRREAEQGHPDGANNFGFCLEHGRGVEQNFELAAQHYKFAADRGHPDAKANHARCLRLLGQWEPPDRSSRCVSHSPSADRLCGIFRDFLRNPEPLAPDERRLFRSLRRLKTAAPPLGIPASSAVAWIPDETQSGVSSVVKLTTDSKSVLIAVKRSKTREWAELIRREAAILQSLKHPLVPAMRPGTAEAHGGNAAIATEYAGNGALAAASHPPSWTCAVRAAQVASRKLPLALPSPCDSRTPAAPPTATSDPKIFCSTGTGPCGSRALAAALPPRLWLCPPPASAAVGPEWILLTLHPSATTFFAFGLVLYRLLAGRPAFDESLRLRQIAFKVLVEDARPEIPGSVPPPARKLIADCWEADPDDRPSFEEIVDRLAAMQFRVSANVNSAKVRAFVKSIEAWEEEHASEEQGRAVAQRG
jgi:serine/threonine protein kinase